MIFFTVKLQDENGEVVATHSQRVFPNDFASKGCKNFVDVLLADYTTKWRNKDGEELSDHQIRNMMFLNQNYKLVASFGGVNERKIW